MLYSHLCVFMLFPLPRRIFQHTVVADPLFLVRGTLLMLRALAFLSPVESRPSDWDFGASTDIHDLRYGLNTC